MKIATIVGARLQFIKAAVLPIALREAGLEEVMIHTGQRYDYEMSELFFEQLGLAPPAHNLGVGSANHGAQTARILECVEQILLSNRSDLLIVYGDTNSTLAGALAAAKMLIPVAHVEAGLRSFNRRMPEEVNRVLTDHVSDLLFAPTEAAVSNLIREGIDRAKMHVTGDVMFDAVLRFEPLFAKEREQIVSTLGLEARRYFVAPIHRAENTDDPARLGAITAAPETIAAEIGPVVWPVHPRARAKPASAGKGLAGLQLIEPIGYLEMQALLGETRGALTDSGGLQKEAASAHDYAPRRDGVDRDWSRRASTCWPAPIRNALWRRPARRAGDFRHRPDSAGGTRAGSPPGPSASGRTAADWRAPLGQP